MINVKISGFDWDAGNKDKCQRHGVSQTVIEQFFKQGSISLSRDKHHSQQEKRFLAIGHSQTKRSMVVAFTLREKDGEVRIRPISARYMHAKEFKKYEKENPHIQEW